ncbi:hypothetical protein [Mesobacillus subterraneus]|uniref:hypothetical protein n=1 Tax=Mesobacillus subterraneus TaxID=285983 RepID=UPI001CFC7C1C|nr:hypothetical protein [Mesobacillus subterraneus]
MEEQKLSEVNAGSDKTAYGRSENCPKSSQVRTKQLMEEQILSEVIPGSDKTASGRIEIVRSHPRFGQNSLWKSRNCPKSPQVQTKQPAEE